MSEYAPGPWSICGTGLLRHPQSDTIIESTVIEAANWGRIGEWVDCSDEEEANVRLIAAAPAMADALRNITNEANVARLRGADIPVEKINAGYAALALLEEPAP